jgi:hypothetical protein
MDRSSHGVFFLKNQTEVNYPFDHRARTASSPSPSELPTLLLVPSSTASTFVLKTKNSTISEELG